MQTGALVMVDALGFKGIWKRQDPEQVIHKLVDLEGKINEVLREATQPPQAIVTYRVAFLSDTVVFGIAKISGPPLPAGFNPGERFAKLRGESFVGLTTCLAMHFASVICERAGLTSPPLAYRGCVTYGDFSLHGNFIVGQAVDQAAEMLNKAQGAFIWASPEALIQLEQMARSHASFDGAVRYRVPMKGGDCYETFAVSPFRPSQSKEEQIRLRDAILSTFVGGTLDVGVKKQNTERFLLHAMRANDPSANEGGTPGGT